MIEASRDESGSQTVVLSRPELPTNRVSRVLDNIIRAIGQWSSWLWVATLLVIIANVVDRFLFGRGSIALEELTWHFFGAAMLLSLSYAVVTDSHVRVDFMRERFSFRKRAWIDMVFIVLLALPVLFLLTEDTYTYARRSFLTMERSQAPSGLPWRFIIKGMMPIGFALLMVALFSRSLKCASLLFGWPRPIWENIEDDSAGDNDNNNDDGQAPSGDGNAESSKIEQ